MKVFGKKKDQVSFEEVYGMAIEYVVATGKAKTSQLSCELIYVKWEQPNNDMVKLNVDMAAKNTPDQHDLGGIFSD